MSSSLVTAPTTYTYTPDSRVARAPIALTPRQRRFCHEYVIDLNASAAYLRAGYRDGSGSNASGLLSLPRIQHVIAQLKLEQEARTHVSADLVIREIARLAFSDNRKLFGADGRLLDIKSLPDDIAAAISSIEVVREVVESDDGTRETTYTHKIKLWSKPHALNQLAKHFRLLTDLVELSGRVDVVAVNTIDLDQLSEGTLRELSAMVDGEIDQREPAVKQVGATHPSMETQL